jgi:hypothetical protein
VAYKLTELRALIVPLDANFDMKAPEKNFKLAEAAMAAKLAQ